MVNPQSIPRKSPHSSRITGAESLRHSPVGLWSFGPADAHPIGGAQPLQLRPERGVGGMIS